MTQYLLSVHTSGDPARRPMTGDEMRRSWEVIETLEAEMRADGALVMSGRLAEPAATSVVQVRDGATTITDGPFIETKEHLGGFYIIEAPDLGAAQLWASKVTAAISEPIEVRPFVGLSAG